MSKWPRKFEPRAALTCLTFVHLPTKELPDMITPHPGAVAAWLLPVILVLAAVTFVAGTDALSPAWAEAGACPAAGTGS